MTPAGRHYAPLSRIVRWRGGPKTPVRRHWLLQVVAATDRRVEKINLRIFYVLVLFVNSRARLVASGRKLVSAFSDATHRVFQFYTVSTVPNMSFLQRGLASVL